MIQNVDEDALSNYITGLGYDVDGNNDPLYDKTVL